MNQPDAGYEFFDHTADMGVRVFAPNLAGLVRPATQGLYALIGELATSGGADPLELDQSATDRPGSALLLRDYLAELLVIFERDQRIASHVEVSRFDDQQLTVSARTALVDEARSVYHREVKAITYHELAVRRTADGYEATFIADI